MRILVVDDEPLVARTLGLIFERHGFHVSTAHSTGEALAAAPAFAPDLLLCDIDMPGRDGVDLMQNFARELPACPILVLTGFYSALARVRECATTLPQPVDIVTKPCQPSDLLRSATTLLRTA